MKPRALIIGLLIASPVLLKGQEREASTPIQRLEQVRNATINGEYRRAYDLTAIELNDNTAWNTELLFTQEAIARELSLSSNVDNRIGERAEEPGDGETNREAWLLRGLRGLKGGDKGWARTCFNRAIIDTDTRDRISSEALYWIGVSHADGQSARDMQEAVSALTACAEHQPAGPKADDALYLLGELHERSGNLADARAAYQRVINAYPTSQLLDDAVIRVANCTLLEGEYQETIAGLDRATAAISARTGDVALLRGYAQLGLGNYTEAEKAFITVVYGSDSANVRRATMGLADTYLDAGRPDSAFTIYRRLAGTGNDRIALQARFKEGSALLRAGEIEKGEAQLRSIAADSTNEYHDRALLEIAALHYSQGSFASVIAETEHLRSSRAERIATEASLLRGVALIALQDYPAAAAALEAAERETEKSSTGANIAIRRNDIALLRGIALTLAGKTSESIAILDNLASSQPGYDQNDRAAYWLGEAYYRAGMMAASAQTLEWLVEKHPTSLLVPEALYTSGWAYLRLGRIVKAEGAFASLVKAYPLTPHLADAQTRRGDCLMRLGRPAEAIAAYTNARANNADGSTEYTDYQIALANYRLQNFQIAATELDRFIEKYPTSELADDAIYLAGSAALSEKRYTGTIEEMNQLIRRYPQSDLIAGAYQNIATANALLENYADAYAGYTIVADRFEQSRFAPEAREMRKRIARLLEEEEDDKYVMLRTAAIFLAAGDYTQARQTYEKAITTGDNEMVRLKGLLGVTRTYIEAGDTTSAIQTLARFDEHTEKAGPQPATMLALAQTYIEIHRNEEALNTLKMMRAAWPEAIETAQGTLVEAGLHMQAEDSTTAVELLQSNALRFEDKEEGARSLIALAKIRSAAGDVDTARHTLMKVAERNDTIGAEALLQIGEMDQKAGAYLEANRTFEELVRRFSSSSRWKRRAQLAMARSYEQLGEREKARALYQDIVTTTSTDDIGRQAAERLKGIETL
jgi:TolA-binding protein